MNKKKTVNENERSFSDLTNKSWFMDGENIRIGENLSKIMTGESVSLIVKEILPGNPYQTWKIVIDKNDKIHLLKSSRELK
jgi:hypothetical protein